MQESVIYDSILLTTLVWTLVCVLVSTLLIWLLVWRRSSGKSNPLKRLFGVAMLGAFFFPIIQGILSKDTIKVLIVDETHTHREVMVKGVFHPRSGEDLYPNDEAIKSRTVLYNNTNEDLILYSVHYDKQPSYQSSGLYSFGHIIKAGEYIIISPYEKPDYCFQTPPATIRVQTNGGRLSGAVRNVLDTVSSLENQGFVVDQHGIIKIE